MKLEALPQTNNIKSIVMRQFEKMPKDAKKEEEDTAESERAEDAENAKKQKPAIFSCTGAK